MKKLLIFFSLIILSICTDAQTKGVPVTIPNYTILTVDSNYATAADLKKDRRVMLIYFAPDCPHCQKLTMELKSKMQELGNTQIVMITWYTNDIRALKTFYKEYELKKYPNITMGAEALKGKIYPVMDYFQVRTTPYIAIYNPQHKLTKAFSKEPEVDDVIAAVKKAK